MSSPPCTTMKLEWYRDRVEGPGRRFKLLGVMRDTVRVEDEDGYIRDVNRLLWEADMVKEQ